MARLTDLILVVIIAGIAVLLTFMIPDALILRAIFGIPFVLVLPGYAITAAAFSKQVLGISERLLLSVGLSLVTTIVGSLLLYLTMWGLSANSWAFLLFGITVGTSLIAGVRRLRNSSEEAVPVRLGMGLGQFLVFGLAALMVLGAIGLARTPLPSQSIQGYTELWMVPAGNENPGLVRLGINSMELEPVSYKLEVQANAQSIREWPSIELTPGGKWETTFALPPDTPGEKVEAVIYRLDAPGNVYRKVALWPN